MLKGGNEGRESAKGIVWFKNFKFALLLVGHKQCDPRGTGSLLNPVGFLICSPFFPANRQISICREGEMPVPEADTRFITESCTRFLPC